MTQGNLIQLKIDRSLSYTIDKKLDTELGQDIQLNNDQWQSVFDIVKNDNAVNTKQYRGEGNDINSGKDFVVNQNQVYKFTQQAWNAIKEIAQNSIKPKEKTAPKVEEKNNITVQNDKVAIGTEKDAYDYEGTVLNILNDANIDTSDIEVNDVIQKYKNIVEYTKANNIQIDDSKIAERIINYANGLKFANVEAKFDNTIKDYMEGNTDSLESDEIFINKNITNAINSGDMTTYKNSLYKFAEEQIETYDDSQGDGKVSFDEFLAKEEEKMGVKLEEEEKVGAKKIFDFLDKNQSGYIDKDEFAAYLLTMSKITDGNDKKTADDITFKEYTIANNALSEIGMSEENNTTKIFRKYFEGYYQKLKQ